MDFLSDTERATGALADWGTSWLYRACAHLPYGLFLLDTELTVRAHFGRALQADLPVQVKSGRLVLPMVVRQRVQLLLSGKGVAWPALVRVKEPGATSAALVIDRVHDRVHDNEASALWTVRVFAEDGVVPTSKALCVTYLMTPSEAGVVRHLLAGRCLRAAAQQLRISHETARSHLKVAFHKANVRCQAALVARVMSGPAIVLGGDHLSRSATIPV